MQYPFWLVSNVKTSLRTSLSAERIDHYMPAANQDPDLAFLLMLWDTKLAESLYHPLQTAEVTLRNALATILIDEFQIDWWSHKGFTSPLSDEELGDLEKALKRATKTHGSRMTGGHLITRLPLGFWQHLLTHKRARQVFLKNPLAARFPAVARDAVNEAFAARRIASRSPISPSRPYLFRPYSARSHVPARELIDMNEIVREKMWETVDKIRTTRNRIAHQQPLFDKGPHLAYQMDLKLTGWISTDAAWLAASFNTFEEMLQCRPKLIW